MKAAMMAATLPAWLVRGIVMTIVGALITGFGAWSLQLSSKTEDHEKRLSVAEEHMKSIDSSLQEIKQGQIEQRQDTKDVLKALNHRR